MTQLPTAIIKQNPNKMRVLSTRSEHTNQPTRERGMEGAVGSKGAYRHVILAKLREGVPEEKLKEMLDKFLCLPYYIPSMKSFHWGKDESTKMKHKGYTYVFEATFDSMADISGYYDHPAHEAFETGVSEVVEDYIVVNYKPIDASTPLPESA